MNPSLTKTDRLDSNDFPIWTIHLGEELVANFGAGPYLEGCLFWFEPTEALRKCANWVFRNAHIILNNVCFGRFVVVSVADDDYPMLVLARRAGFELLEAQSGRTLYYLTVT